MFSASETYLVGERKISQNSHSYVSRNITKALTQLNTMKRFIKESPNMSLLIGVNIINAIFWLVS